MAQCDKAETNYVIKGFDIFDKDLLNLLSAISSVPL